MPRRSLLSGLARAAGHGILGYEEGRLKAEETGRARQRELLALAARKQQDALTGAQVAEANSRVAERTDRAGRIKQRVQMLRGRPEYADPERFPDEALTGLASDDATFREAFFPKPEKATAAGNWQIIETAEGFVQVNPQTGETRPLNLQGKPLMPRPSRAVGAATTPSSYTFPVGADPEGKPVILRANTRTGEVEPTSVGARPPTSSGGASLQKAVATNEQQLAVIDDALKELDERPNAVGLKRGIPVVGDVVNQRVDPEGVAARASIANIGSLQVHDRSGAAVSVHEFPRLAPFVPNVHDTPNAIRTKLRKLKESIQIETEALRQSGTGPTAPSAPRSPPPTPAAGARTHEQELWDAAVAKHGRAKVLAEYGPRPQ